MNNSWKVYKFSDAPISIIDGDRGKNYPKRNEFSEEGYCLFLNANNVTKEGFSFNSKQFITKEKDELLRSGKLSRGDVVMTTRGTIGNVAYYGNRVPFEHVRINSGMVIFRCERNKILPLFLFQYLRSPIFQAQINAFRSGVAQPQLPICDIKRMRISIPSLPEQYVITSILSAYDDLIENNTRRIQILEEMAQLIYREWFVNFRFPGHEKVRFVNSKLGKIPEGWEVVQLGEVLESIESGSRPKGGIDSSEREVPSIGAENVLGLGRYDFNKEKYVSREFYENMRKGKVQSGDVLLYKDGAKIGRKSMFRDGFPHEVCCINEHVFILRTNSRCSQNYLYFYLDRPDITQKIINLNTNAAQPGINQAGVKSLPILLPPKELIELFDNKVEPLLGLLFNLAKKNQTLRKKRDLLLPKLISGEIDVSNLEIIVKEF